MNTAKLFQNGNSQAIRIPKKYRMPGTEVLISKKDDTIILTPVPANWEMLFSALDEFPEDFMATGRQQPDTQTREGF